MKNKTVKNKILNLKKMKKRKIALIVLLLLGLYLYNENTSLQTTNYEIVSEKLPSMEEDYIIAQISDFHNTKSNRLRKVLAKQLKKANPDIIVITGDLIDSRRTDIEASLSFVDSIKDIAPIYYVTGNHESRIFDYFRLEEGLKDSGVVILNDDKHLITDDQQEVIIDLVGLDEPSFLVDELDRSGMQRVIEPKLEELTSDGDDHYRLLLSHRPELLPTYSAYDIDLVLSGHAHGGQIVVPFVGPILAPNQGFFPKMTFGIHENNETKMIISRGIGNSVFPFRINNNPELVVISLKEQEKKKVLVGD